MNKNVGLKKRISVISKAVEKVNSRASTLELTQPDVVQILTSRDGRTLWVNVDGVCRLRACKIKTFIMEDNYGRTNYHARH